MSLFVRILAITVAETAATALFERGVFFHAKTYLAFGDAANLLLALAHGAAYVVGALQSHRACERFGEKAVVRAAILGQLAALLLVILSPAALSLQVANAAIGYLNGLKWPPVESYVAVCAGPAETARRIGRFNVTWGGTVPLAVATCGVFIAWGERGLFVPPFVLSLVSLWLLKRVPARPAYLPAGAMEAAMPPELSSVRRLLAASRWALLLKYSFLWILSPLAPRVFAELGFSVEASTALWSLCDLTRVLCFLALERSTAWHGRASVVLLATLGLPAGFVLVVAGHNTALVLLGELAFGAAAGVAYHAALYYAMLVKDARVDAGGVHEGIIGLGFVIGPFLGIAGEKLHAVAGPSWGLLVGVAPVVLACSAGSLRALLGLRGGRREREGTAEERGPPPGL
jgi:hypothetical protein